jgi:hypothetical protein
MSVAFRNVPAGETVWEKQVLPGGKARFSMAETGCRAYIPIGGLRFPAGETYPRGLIDP